MGVVAGVVTADGGHDPPRSPKSDRRDWLVSIFKTPLGMDWELKKNIF